METKRNLYAINNNKRSFSGIVNPYYEENELPEQKIFDILNFNPEVEKIAAPKGINKYLFKIMQTATNSENDIFNNL